MEVKACKRCGTLFQYVTGKSICPNCKKKEEEQFELVKDYLREHPGSIIRDISEGTGASIPLIESFLKQGRLEVSADSPITLLCEKCGAKIKSGRYCPQCTHSIATEINGMANAMKPTETLNVKKEKERMRFLDSQRIKK